MTSRGDLPDGVVTLVFTDIEGSTRLLHELGERYVHALTEHRRLMRSAFSAGGGVEVDTQGDAFFVAFPDASRALVAVAEAQRALAAHTWPDGRDVRVRVGVHTGQPLRTGEGYAGLCLHEGARVMGCAHGEQVVVSAATAVLATRLDGLFLRDLGEHRLKDLSEPQRLFQLCGEGLREDFPPLKSLGGYFTNLPIQSSPLIGRDRELRELAELLSAHRLVTLTGPGGTGKTRLALQAAAETLDDFPGGVFFCDLAPLGGAELVASSIAQAIGLRENPGETTEQTVASYVGDKQLLLVLDNFEHLLDAAPLVARLLGVCPRLRVLATSRAPLRISGEREFPVESLALPDAVELFKARASLLGQDVTGLAWTQESIEAICVRLDRLPLALELAAARLRSLTPKQVLERLEQGLALLTSGPRDAPERQRTLRATLDWSYDLLDEKEQSLFTRLSVFAGGGTLDAIESICESDLDTLESLVEGSLVRCAGERFRMLETIRQYASEELESRGDVDAVRERHAAWYLALAERARPELSTELGATWLERFAAEHDNIRAVLERMIEHEQAEEAVRLTGAVWSFWMTRGYWTEGRRWLEAALARAGEVDPAARVDAYMGATVLALWQGDVEIAEAHARTLLALARSNGIVRGEAIALEQLAIAAGHRGDYQAGTRLYEQALPLAYQTDDEWLVSIILNNLGDNALNLRDPELAITYFERSLAVGEARGDRDRRARALTNLGLAAQQLGDQPRARRYLEEGLAIAAEIGLQEILLFGLMVLAASIAGDDPSLSALLIGSIDEATEELHAFIDDLEAEQRRATIETLRDSLGERSWELLYSEGRTLTLADAVARVLRVDGAAEIG